MPVTIEDIINRLESKGVSPDMQLDQDGLPKDPLAFFLALQKNEQKRGEFMSRAKTGFKDEHYERGPMNIDLPFGKEWKTKDKDAASFVEGAEPEKGMIRKGADIAIPMALRMAGGLTRDPKLSIPISALGSQVAGIYEAETGGVKAPVFNEETQQWEGGETPKVPTWADVIADAAMNLPMTSNASAARVQALPFLQKLGHGAKTGAGFGAAYPWAEYAVANLTGEAGNPEIPGSGLVELPTLEQTGISALFGAGVGTALSGGMAAYKKFGPKSKSLPKTAPSNSPGGQPIALTHEARLLLGNDPILQTRRAMRMGTTLENWAEGTKDTPFIEGVVSPLLQERPLLGNQAPDGPSGLPAPDIAQGPGVPPGPGFMTPDAFSARAGGVPAAPGASPKVAADARDMIGIIEKRLTRKNIPKKQRQRLEGIRDRLKTLVPPPDDMATLRGGTMEKPYTPKEVIPSEEGKVSQASEEVRQEAEAVRPIEERPETDVREDSLRVSESEATGAGNAAPEPAASKQPWEMTKKGFLSEVGYKAKQGSRTKGNWLSTHEGEVRVALEQGKPVPSSVLADYPDLAAKYAPQVAGKAEAAGVAEATLKVKPGKESIYEGKSLVDTSPVIPESEIAELRARQDTKSPAGWSAKEFVDVVKDIHAQRNAAAKTGGNPKETITIKVPGDGTLNVLNTPKALTVLKNNLIKERTAFVSTGKVPKAENAALVGLKDNAATAKAYIENKPHLLKPTRKGEQGAISTDFLKPIVRATEVGTDIAKGTYNKLLNEMVTTVRDKKTPSAIEAANKLEGQIDTGKRAEGIIRDKYGEKTLDLTRKSQKVANISDPRVLKNTATSVGGIKYAISPLMHLLRGKVASPDADVNNFIKSTQDLTNYTGKLMERIGLKRRDAKGNIVPFKPVPGGKIDLRMMTNEGMDAVMQGSGEKFNALVDATAHASKRPKAEIQKYYEDVSKALKSEEPESAFNRVNAEFFRELPEVPTDIWLKNGEHFRVYETHPYKYVENLIRRTANRYAFVKHFGQDIGADPNAIKAEKVKYRNSLAPIKKAYAQAKASSPQVQAAATNLKNAQNALARAKRAGVGVQQAEAALAGAKTAYTATVTPLLNPHRQALQQAREAYKQSVKAIEEAARPVQTMRDKFRLENEGDATTLVKALRAASGIPVNTTGPLEGLASKRNAQTVGRNLGALKSLVSSLNLTGSAFTQASQVVEIAIRNNASDVANAINSIAKDPKKAYVISKATGYVTGSKHDWTIDWSRPTESLIRIERQALERLTGHLYANELLNEFPEAMVAQAKRDRILAGKGTWSDVFDFIVSREKPSEAQRKVFSPANAAEIDAVTRRTPGTMTGTPVAPAEKTQAQHNRLYRALIRFDSYAVPKARQFFRMAKATTSMFNMAVKQRDAKIAGAAIGKLMKYGVSTTAAGVAQYFAASYLTGGKQGTEQAWNKAKDNWGKFLWESYVYTQFAGPFGQLVRAMGNDGPTTGNKGGDLALSVAKSTLPGYIISEVGNYVSGQGDRYKDKTLPAATLSLFKSMTPITRFANPAMLLGLTDGARDKQLDTAMKGYYDFKREYMPRSSGTTESTKDRDYRVVMRLAHDAIKAGDVSKAERLADRALGLDKSENPERAIKSSLKGRRKLSGLSDEEKEHLKKFIGAKSYRVIEDYDEMLNEVADSL